MTDPAASVHLGPFRSLLVPFDGSTFASAACAFARVLASRGGARTTLLYVGNEPPASLAEEAARFTTPVDVRVLPGAVGDVVTAEAARVDADLLLIGARGRNPLRGILFGSNTRTILTYTTRPTLVVHGPPGAAGPILVAVEPTPAAPGVARAARRLADALQAPLELVTVMTVDRDLAAHPEAYGIARAVWQAKQADLATRTFPPLAPIIGASPAGIRFGLPTDQIRERAHEIGASVVVCGRRGASGDEVDHWRSVAWGLAARGTFATLVV